MPARMTANQASLLDELVEEGGLFITRHSRPHRTVVVLERLGLAHVTEHDFSSMAKDRWEPTERGLDLLAPNRVDGTVIDAEHLARLHGGHRVVRLFVDVPEAEYDWLLDKPVSVTIRKA